LRREADDRRNDESGQYGAAIDEPHGETNLLGQTVVRHDLRPRALLEAWQGVEKCTDGIFQTALRIASSDAQQWGCGMFVGHYGPSFAIRAVRPEVPLWVLFVAAQLVDIAWALLVLGGIEKLRIVPGITAANPLDLYYMPYTHSLVAALLWAGAAAVVGRLVFRWKGWSAAAWVGVAVLSHWVIDWLVHRPDLPLYGDSMKVGLGLWNHVGLSLGLEVLVLGAGLWLYLSRTSGITTIGRYGPVVFVLLMLAVQLASLVGPLPPSPAAVAASALGAYLVFAAVAGWIDRQRVPVARG
jgi:hypothetical protein